MQTSNDQAAQSSETIRKRVERGQERRRDNLQRILLLLFKCEKCGEETTVKVKQHHGMQIPCSFVCKNEDCRKLNTIRAHGELRIQNS